MLVMIVVPVAVAVIVGAFVISFMGPAAKVKEAGHGGHTLSIQDEQKVISRRRNVAVGRRGDTKHAGASRERQADQSLVHIKGMSHSAGTNQHHRLYSGGIRRMHLKGSAVIDSAGRDIADGWPGSGSSVAVEEVWRRVDLDMGLVHCPLRI